MMCVYLPIVIFMVSWFYGGGAWALDELKGYASLTVQSKSQLQHFDQAIRVMRDGKAYKVQLETLDDFGQTWLKLTFLRDQTYLWSASGPQALSTRQKRRLLRMPLSERELAAIIFHKSVFDLDNWTFSRDDQGRIVSGSKDGGDAKRVTLSYEYGRGALPKRVTLFTTKQTMIIEWKKINYSS